MQAHRGQQEGLISGWRPDYLTTVVIIVDRDQTDEVITSWADLTTSSSVVSLNTSELDGLLILGAVEWGLNRELVPGRDAFKLVAELRQADRLLKSSQTAAITMGFDHQAMDRIAAGANLEVIVPAEGTLSFIKGLAAASDNLTDQAALTTQLANRGYRAPDAEPPEGATLIRGAEMPYEGRWMANFRRFGLGDNRLHAADKVETTVAPMLMIVALIAWVGSFARRGSQPSVRRAAILIGALAIFWLLVRLVRYHAVHEGLIEFLWYAYYLPMLGLPLALLWMAWAVDRAIDSGQPPRWWWTLLGLHSALLGLVLTNSAHQLVFEFLPDNSGDYRYVGGYYLVAAAAGIPLLIAIGWLMVKSHKVPGRRYPWLPSLVVLLMAAYLTAYNMGIKLWRQTDVTIGIIVFGVLLVEAAVRTRTLPLNRDYEGLFEASSLRMRIIDADSGAELAAAGSQDDPRPAANLVEFSAPIRGGQVVWAEDISAITSLQHSTSVAIDRLDTLNTMLQARREAERQVVAAGVRAQVLAEMENEVVARVAELDELVAALPAGPVERFPLARIALRVCFVKRRAALFFQLQSGEVISSDEMTRHFVELAQLAEPAGLRCTVQLPDDGDLAVQFPELLYECVFRLIDYAVANRARALVAKVIAEPTGQELRCLLPVEFTKFSFDDDLLTRLAGIGAELGWRPVDESMALTIRVPGVAGAECDD